MLPAHESSANEDGENKQTKTNYLELLLRKYGFDRRLVTLSTLNLPVLTEFQEQGKTNIAAITDFVWSDDEKEKPKLQVQLLGTNDNTMVIDLGQLTTIWWQNDDGNKDFLYSPDTDSSNTKGSIFSSLSPPSSFPLGHINKSLDHLYKSRVGWARNTHSKNGGLTKKQVAKLVAESPDSCQATSVEEVLRQVIKTGSGFARLVDSIDAMEILFDNFRSGNKDESSVLKQDRAIAAFALQQDSQTGGRFKRMPCQFVSSSSSNKNGGTITIVNGGWIVLDRGVRATSEGRKFAERDDPGVTAADGQIIHRLECLAMGESSIFKADDLELNVRETLKRMDLPVTPGGAKDALIKIGKWSAAASNSTKEYHHQKTKVNPWSQTVLEASEWYRDMDKQRRRNIYQSIQRQRQHQGNNVLVHQLLEDRTDLTKLPSICIDAARTSFRDDAIGVRPRAATGRKVRGSNKWEILFHIADVSDIYAPKPNSIHHVPVDNDDKSTTESYLQVLRDAAASRGTSRYDLPLGPLHLMPPAVLQSLGLETIQPDLTSQEFVRMDRPSINRCVTLWAYIDQQTGRLLDCGLERSIISCPLALSYASATDLLDGGMEKQDPILDKARAILAIADRNLNLWNEYHQLHSAAAQAREERLLVRETVGKQIHKTSGQQQRDDGREGFQRTRGHRLVDIGLELHGFAVNGLLRRKKASVPRLAGTGRDRLGRIATGPLRRYVDGMAQRQVLALFCGYGGDPMTKDECAKVGKEATKVINTISNTHVSKQRRRSSIFVSTKQQKAVRALKSHMIENEERPVPAMSTGKSSEVVILGVGALATCSGIKGTLKPGSTVMVKIKKVDEENGKVSAVLVEKSK